MREREREIFWYEKATLLLLLLGFVCWCGVCVCVCATQLGWKAVTAQVMDQHECVCYEHTIAVKQGAMFFDGDETPVASG